MNSLILKVRSTAHKEWVNNFTHGGWSVKLEDGTWKRMTPDNTKVRNPEYLPDTDINPWLAIVEEHGV